MNHVNITGVYCICCVVVCVMMCLNVVCVSVCVHLYMCIVCNI